MNWKLYLKAWYRTISEHDLNAHLMTSKGGSPPPDILVRTSGVKRLSDFLLWQVIILSTWNLSYRSQLSLVLRKYTDSVLKNVLARLWTV